MNRRTALRAGLGAGLTLACSRPQPAPASEFLGELLRLAGVEGGKADDALAGVDRLVEKARQRSARGEAPADALARGLFDDLRFEREVEDRSPGTMLLPPVIKARRGGCVGLGTLFLAAAERWGIPAAGVLVPGHFFVRALAGGGRMRNVELLRRGEEMPASWYRERYGLPPGEARVAPAYLRDLTPNEVLAVVRFNLGNDLRARGDLKGARALYSHASSFFPDFAEAHASIGLCAQLQGDLDRALGAYNRAASIYPALPGLQQNLSALGRERAAASKATSSPTRTP
jgi:regulator of sirC expression with transglutaminase-like and TPR domain